MLNAAIVESGIPLFCTPDRGCLLEALLFELRQMFPQVSYELDLGSRTANAQALARGNDRVVRLYGGLALHPMVGEDTLGFALLHETGHHFARGRRFALDPMLACDRAADIWAVTTGAELWFQAFGRGFDIGRAFEGIAAMIADTRGGLRLKRSIVRRGRKLEQECRTWNRADSKCQSREGRSVYAG